jgi:hypothetical protein
MANKDRDRLMDTEDKKDAAGLTGGAFAGGAVGGIAGGAMAGAAAGGLGGPAGAAIGAAVGAVAGALGGKAIADSVDPEAEDAYWKSNYSSRSYVGDGSSYDDYQPAYRMGYERYPEFHGRDWNDIEPEFERHWDTSRGNSRLSWPEAKHATRDAWQRTKDTVERAAPGDSDGDGK